MMRSVSFAPWRRRSEHGESGQVMVEQAIILPVMVFLILGIMQLAMLQHARIATHYAAYQAARAGIVYNGDKAKMTRAAFLSLLPTYGRSDSWSEILPTLGEAALAAFASQIAGLIAEKLGISGMGSQMPMLKVDILPPPDADGWSTLFDTYGQHLNKKQLDFDDWRDTPARANAMSVKVRYLYQMRIPFANWMIQTMWIAGQVGTLENYGGVNFAAPEYTVGGGGFSVNTGISANMVTEGKGWAGSGVEDDTVADTIRAVLGWKRAANIYVFPITTWYTMRMQSNLYRSNVE